MYQKYYEDYLNGLSITGIAKKYQVSKQCVSQAIYWAKKPKRPKTYPCVYPAIRAWMEEHDKTMNDMSNLTGCQLSRLYYIFKGQSRPRKDAIDALIKVTGIAYEDLFRTQERK